jgi:hypothetical protein
VLIKPDLPTTLHSLIFMGFSLFPLIFFYLLKYRDIRMRIPLAPALCVGLLL